MAARHRLRRDERGLTLAEVLISMFLLMAVSAVFLPVMESAMRVTRDVTYGAQTNDAGRIALAQLDREFRAAERICDPLPGDSGDRLSFRTRAYTVNVPASGYRDIVYEVRDPDGDGLATDLQRQVDGGGWSTVVPDVVNQDLGVTIFTTEGGSASTYPSEGKVITVRVWVDSSATDRIGPRLVTTELSGRNIWTPNQTTC